MRRKSLFIAVLLTLTALLLFAVLQRPEYDLTKVVKKGSCFDYKNQGDVILIAAYAIKSELGSAELKKQGHLKIEYEDSQAYFVRGRPNPRFIEFVKFGGGAAFVKLDKMGACLVVDKVLLEK